MLTKDDVVEIAARIRVDSTDAIGLRLLIENDFALRCRVAELEAEVNGLRARCAELEGDVARLTKERDEARAWAKNWEAACEVKNKQLDEYDEKVAASEMVRIEQSGCDAAMREMEIARHESARLLDERDEALARVEAAEAREAKMRDALARIRAFARPIWSDARCGDEMKPVHADCLDDICDMVDTALAAAPAKEGK